MIGNLVRDVLENARIVRDKCGKSVLVQFREILRARMLNPTLGASDYYAYRLYDTAVREASDPRDFLGWRVEADLAYALNPRNVVLPAWDKYTFHALATDRGLPVPRLAAAYLPAALPAACSATTLHTPDDLARFLRSNSEWPLFLKPSYSQKGVGARLLRGHDIETDAIETADGDIPVRELVAAITDARPQKYVRPEMGALFQEVLVPHPAIAERTESSAVSGVRVVVVRDGDRAKAIKALWKVATGGNTIDNFHDGALGNLIAEVDLSSGRVGRAIGGKWPAAELVAAVPTSGRPIDGFVLPCWSELIACCERAAAIAPMMRILHWDAAITARGPVLIELNDHGSIGWLQMLGPGLLSTDLRSVIARHADRELYRWVSKLV